MRLTLWGTRGSIACSGPSTARYGGDTASIEVRSDDDSLIVIDAGSGIRALGANGHRSERIDILLSHLHMDHIQGLPFFAPLFAPGVEVHLWGPGSTAHSLRERVGRYLSPPLFPVGIRELPNIIFHDVLPGTFSIGSLEVTADHVAHPGATVGYRLEENGKSAVYLSDHEPALGADPFPIAPEWTSGYGLAANADILIHDSQYTDEEYSERIGWGHTSFSQLAAFAEMANVSRLVTFHHDPGHTDDMLDEAHRYLESELHSIEVIAGKQGVTLQV